MGCNHINRAVTVQDAYMEGYIDGYGARCGADHLYKRVIRKNGIAMQVNVAIEEMSELTKCLCKDLRGAGSIYQQEQIAEEVVDVEIMLEQLKLIYEISKGQIAEQRQKKLRRLEQMLEGL